MNGQRTTGMGETRRWLIGLRRLALRLRLVSGLVLFVFVAMHLVNLSLGLASVGAMEAARPFLMGVWTSLAGTLLLGLSALVHVGFGLVTIGRRRSLALGRADWVQMLLGLITPPLLLNHVITMAILRHVQPGFTPDFLMALTAYWKFSPAIALQQVLVLVVVWVHAAIGLHRWLVLKSFWPSVGPLLAPVLFAIPVLALLGFVQGGKQALVAMDQDPAWQAHVTALVSDMAAGRQRLQTLHGVVWWTYAGLALIALLALLRRILRRRGRAVTVTYDGDVVASGRSGLSLLELGLKNGIPHAHVCGGRGRCGTCLVDVTSGRAGLSPVRDLEARMLARLGAGPGDRLACQACLLAGSVTVVRRTAANADAATARVRLANEPSAPDAPAPDQPIPAPAIPAPAIQGQPPLEPPSLEPPPGERPDTAATVAPARETVR